MKKTILYMSILFSMISLTGCLKSTTFTSEDKAFYIKAPSEFTKNKYSHNLDVQFSEGLKGKEDTFEETLNIYTEDSKENLDLKGFYEYDSKDTQEFLTEYKEEKVETTKLQGKDAYKVTYTALISGKPVKFIKHIVKHKNTFYVIVFQTEEEKYEAYKEMLNQTLSTIKFN